jgi:hypothetical protein
MSSAMLNSLGLVLDIIGAMLLWHYVADASFKQRDMKPGAMHMLELGEVTVEEARAFQIAKWMSRLGIALLILGFILQLWSDWVK